MRFFPMVDASQCTRRSAAGVVPVGTTGSSGTADSLAIHTSSSDNCQYKNSHDRAFRMITGSRPFLLRLRERCPVISGCMRFGASMPSGKRGPGVIVAPAMVAERGQRRKRDQVGEDSTA